MKSLILVMLLLGCNCIVKAQLVEISNGKINTSVIGNGSKTIVMLSDLTTSNPIEDFMTLAEKLSKNFKVVIIEYPGYGASDVISDERSNKNIVKEIRETLNKLEIKPPYVLMPHSISVIYSLWYAKNYPDEVEAIVGIDTSKPNAQKEFLESNESCVKWFSEKLDRSIVNESVFNEATMFYKNCEEFFDAKYPEDLPVLSFVSSENIEFIKNRRSLLTGSKVTDWDKLEQIRISNPKIQKIEILEGSHYWHHEQTDKIEELATEFINNNCKRRNIVDYTEQFGSEKGCAVFYDSALNEYDIHNKDMVHTEVSPCSTFKIILSLAGLEKGVLQNENTTFEWDGVTRELPQWNKDLNLKEAFRCSAVWWFYKVFNKIGKETVEETIRKTFYGNMDSTAEGKFWLGSSLKTSAFEQVEFLKKLFSYEFDFKKENIGILKNIMFVEEINGCKIYGKTGANVDSKIGWFIGFYEKNENKTYFTVRINEGENISGVRAREIARSIIGIREKA